MRFEASSGVSRVAVTVVLVLWCLLSLTVGATQAHCLEVDGACSPSTAAPAGPCHGQAPDSGVNPGCGTCIDVHVPEESSASCNRPDRDLQDSAAAQSLPAAIAALVTREDTAVLAAAFQGANAPLHLSQRTTVLRI